MRRIAILTPRLNRRDAVGNDIVGMYRILSQAGHDVRIFADTSETELPVHPPAGVPGFLQNRQDLLIYHYSIAWQIALALFQSGRFKKVIKYHNVTPATFFDPYHPGIAGSCRQGRAMLGEFIAAGCDLFIGDSKYNVAEGRALGQPAKRCRVVPPLHRIDDLLNQPADLDLLAPLAIDQREKRINLLSVGRLVPNKGFMNLIRAFSEYQNQWNNQARLLIVGRPLSVLYDYYLELIDLIKSTGVEKSVIFSGGVSDAALKTYYLSADIFVLLSEHEGFCVPLVEAMAHKIPIVTLDSAAIAETAGDAALIWEHFDPGWIAASIDRLVCDKELARELGEQGYHRYRSIFTNEAIGRNLIEALNPWLSVDSDRKN